MEQDRYSRQRLFAPIGEDGQAKIMATSVLIVGMGALGTASANQLVRAGFGRIRFIDRDFVEWSNLQRQSLFSEQDAEQRLPKAIAAAERLQAVNSSVQIEGIVGDLTAANIAEYAKDVDMILDGTDNFETRFVINDYAQKEGIPYIYGGAVSSRGMQATFVPGETPCLRCLFEEASGASETCDIAGVIAPIIETVVSHQVVDALKIATGQTEKLRRSLVTFDVWSGYRYELKWTTPKANCQSCQLKLFPALQPAVDDQLTTLCGRNSVQISPKNSYRLNLNELANRLKSVGTIEQNPFLLRFQIDQYTLVIFQDGRAIIQGTEDKQEAKIVYAKYVGM